MWFHIYLLSRKYLQTSNLPIFRMTWPHTEPMSYIFPYTAFCGPVQLILPYSSRCNSNTKSLDNLPLTSPYSYLLDISDSHYSNQFLTSPNMIFYKFQSNIQPSIQKASGILSTSYHYPSHHASSFCSSINFRELSINHQRTRFHKFPLTQSPTTYIYQT